MKNGFFRESMILVTLLVICALIAPAAMAGVDRSSACVRVALSLERAGIADADDEFHESIAVCKNIPMQAERQACRVAASDAKEEFLQEVEDQFWARVDACDLLEENRYFPDPLTDPSNVFVDPAEIGESVDPNTYFDLTLGRTWVLRAGEDFAETVVVTVTDEIEDINGVPCVTVVDAVVEAEDEDGGINYEPVEVTDDFYAQESNGDVYYCGEISRNWEEGFLDNLDGSFRSGYEDAKGGLLIREDPTEGESHRQEYALNEAEDAITYIDLATGPSAEEGGENTAFPCESGCLKTFDFAPLDPASTEYKYYLPELGFVLAVGMDDGELNGEREELVCIGDDLSVLSDPACEIEDLEALLDALCEVSDAFCPQEPEI